MNITFVEWKDRKIKKSESAGKGREKSPATDLPQRNQTFENSGNQNRASKGGQRKPGRRMGNGTRTKPENVNEEKQFMNKKQKNKEKKMKNEKEKDESWVRPFMPEEEVVEDEKPRPAEGGSVNETEPVVGYGMPTKGAYDTTEGGYKTFGTEGQGEDTEGVKDISDPEEESRSMIISVTAVANQASTTMELQTGNFEFLEEYQWAEAANGLKVFTLAASFFAFNLI